MHLYYSILHLYYRILHIYYGTTFILYCTIFMLHRILYTVLRIYCHFAPTLFFLLPWSLLCTSFFRQDTMQHAPPEELGPFALLPTLPRWRETQCLRSPQTYIKILHVLSPLMKTLIVGSGPHSVPCSPLGRRPFAIRKRELQQTWAEPRRLPWTFAGTFASSVRDYKILRHTAKYYNILKHTRKYYSIPQKTTKYY